MKTNMKANTITRWFFWSNWSTEKVEEWLEAQAARGWHLVKADRLMLRFHFQRDTPKTVRYCVDYPDEATDEYHTIFNDGGWDLAATDLGWYIWRMEYSGDRRPELFNDVEPLIARNNRLLLLFGGALLGQVGIVVTDAGNWLVASPIGRAILVPYGMLILFIFAAFIATYRHNRRLQDRRS